MFIENKLATNVIDANEITFSRRIILFTAETTMYTSGGRYANLELERRQTLKT